MHSPFPQPIDAIAARTESTSSAGVVSIMLRLSPVPITAAHAYMDVTLHWTPDGEGEVARRRAEGLPVGADIRRSLQQRPVQWPWSGNLPTGQLNVNSVGPQPTSATTATIELTQTAGLLQCKNCFAVFQGTFSITFAYCLGSNLAAAAAGPTPALTPFWFTSQDSTGCLGQTAPSAPVPGTSTATCPVIPNTITTTNFADCSPAISWINNAAVTSSTTTPSIQGTPATTFNAAVNIEAFMSGTATVQFEWSSNGFSSGSGPSNTGGCTQSGDSSTCTPFTVVPLSPSLSITIAPGISAVIQGGMTAAVVYSGNLAGQLRVGTSASVAGFKLGGKLAFTDFTAQAPSCGAALTAGAPSRKEPTTTATACAAEMVKYATAYNNFPLTFRPSSLSASLTGLSVASIDATLFTNIKVRFSLTPGYTTLHS